MLQRKHRISKIQRGKLLKEFIKHHTAVEAAEDAKVSRNTANLWFGHFRQAIFEHYSMAPRFDGEVEIDETVFGKGLKRRTYEKQFFKSFLKEHGITQKQWLKMRKKQPEKVKKVTTNILVFGIQQRGGNVFTRIIEKRDRKTILPIIHLVVEGGATIYSDMNRAYDILENDGYIHKTVNHSKGFVNKEGVHIATMESFWAESKKHFMRFKGIARRTFPLHIKECEFRWNHRKDKKLMTNVLRKLAF